jgi:vanillate O-demethylase monooxygenase subunit
MKTVNESFLWNCWYAAAWENEIEDGKALARTFLEKPIVIFRGESGGYTALDNRCCHRAAPLSSGRIEGDCIRCMYHGMKYDTTGKCVEIPGQDKISDVHRVHSYPIVEKGHLLWIWMGDPERADENDIPHYEPLDDPNWVGLPRECYLNYDANWLLIMDNLADFSHLAFVHTNTLGGSEDYALSSEQQVDRLPNGFEFTRVHENDDPPPYHAKVTPLGPDTPVDRRNKVTLLTPGVFFMETIFSPVGWDPDSGDMEGVTQYRNCQYMTPESRTKAHFFWNYLRDYRRDEPEVSQSLQDSMLEGFFEDKVIIEEQQKLLEAGEDFQARGLASDSALAHFRKVWREMIEEERKTYPPEPEPTKNPIL